MSSSNRESLDLYWEKALTQDAPAANIRELFLMRVAAYTRIADKDEVIRAKAKQFLLKTMSDTEEEYGFAAKIDFVGQVSSWDFPEILTQRSDDIHLIVYKIKISIKGAEQTLHDASFFQKDNNQNFIYTHKYNITELTEKFCSKAPAVIKIRQIGDPVLHRKAQQVTDFATSKDSQMHQQMDVLKAVLYETGGVGIAANQCLQIEQPLSIVLAGVNYENEEHAVKAINRYPTALFPKMQVYINPKVVSLSDEFEVFPEGCLSVQGILRAFVLRPSAVTIEYQDQLGEVHQKSFTGSDARVMLHELDHITNGKVYIQRIIEELSIFQLNKFEELVRKVLSEASENHVVSSFSKPIVIFSRDEAGKLTFEDKNVLDAISKIPRATLNGVYDDLKNEVKKRNSLQYSLLNDKNNGQSGGEMGSGYHSEYKLK